MVPVLKGGWCSTLSPAGTLTTGTLVPRYEVSSFKAFHALARKGTGT